MGLCLFIHSYGDRAGWGRLGNDMVSLDVNNLKKCLPGEVLLQEVEVMVVEEVVRGQRVLPRSSPTLSLGRGGLRLAAWEGVG